MAEQVFATVNIADSQHAQVLSETAARDSSAMKQVRLYICLEMRGANTGLFRSHISQLYFSLRRL